MLRPFNSNPTAPEKWPRRTLQEPRSFRASANGEPQGSTAVANAPTSQAARHIAEAPVDVRCIPVSANDAHFDRVRRLALRYFASFDGSVHVNSIVEIRSATQRGRFDSRRAELKGSRHPTVAKFAPVVAAASVRQSCAVAAETYAVDLPMGLGKGICFPNVYFTAAAAPQPGAPGAADVREVELVLCEVAVGALCVRPSDVLHNCADGRAPADALRSAGFDSVALRLDGEDNIAVFDSRLALPTHTVCVSLVPPAPCSTESPNTPPSRSTRDHDSPQAAEPSPTSVRAQFNRALDDAEASVGTSSQQLQALIRRQCADLEEAVRARREWLLAAVRREESQAVLAIRQRRSNPGLVTASDIEAAPATLNTLGRMHLDTSRALATIDNMVIRTAMMAGAATNAPVAGPPRSEGHMALAAEVAAVAHRPRVPTPPSTDGDATLKRPEPEAATLRTAAIVPAEAAGSRQRPSTRPGRRPAGTALAASRSIGSSGDRGLRPNTGEPSPQRRSYSLNRAAPQTPGSVRPSTREGRGR